MTELAISVAGLRKSYGDTEAVAGVDLQVRHGEVFALLGPNGAGKTTTVEILEGFRKRGGGHVSVLGADPANAGADWRQRIGIVLQGTGEFDELTVGEVVKHFTRFYRKAADPTEVIKRVGLTEKTNSRTHTLSGGQKRRLDVALGIINQPELLFLDEPTTGFDPAARREFWKVIDDLAHKGTTIVLTTHYLEEAEVLADRVAVINHGKLIEVSTPAELGGRNHASVTVAWRDGSEETDEPTKVVQRLAAHYDGEIPELVVKRPTLEDVYLKMIGQR